MSIDVWIKDGYSGDESRSIHEKREMKNAVCLKSGLWNIKIGGRFRRSACTVQCPTGDGLPFFDVLLRLVTGIAQRMQTEVFAELLERVCLISLIE